MGSHFSAIGFDLHGDGAVAELVTQVAPRALSVRVQSGRYLRWIGGAGEELWIQVSRRNEIVGLTPYFNGKSSMRVGVKQRVHRPSDSTLDGAFYGMAHADENDSSRGSFPIVFDVPDAGTYADLALSCVADAKVTAFAEKVTFHESADTYLGSETCARLEAGSQSFVPTGMFSVETEMAAHAHVTGKVIESALLRNAWTYRSFYWALIETRGGRLDVVIDPAELPCLPTPGGVLGGLFWMSGRLFDYPKSKRSWFQRVLEHGRSLLFPPLIRAACPAPA